MWKPKWLTPISPTTNFEDRAKSLPTLSELKCNVKGLGCFNIYNEGIKKYLTVEHGELAFVDQPSDDFTTMWTFNKGVNVSKTGSLLTHPHSKLALNAKMDSAKSGSMRLVSETQGSLWKHDSSGTGGLDCLGCNFKEKGKKGKEEKNLKFFMEAAKAPEAPKTTASGNTKGLLVVKPGQSTGKDLDGWTFKEILNYRDYRDWFLFFEDFGYVYVTS